MEFSYLLGIIFAILSGVSNNFGTVIQKKVVNTHKEESKFLKTLIKNPMWLFGLIMQQVFGGIFWLVAQIYIGPTLIPGLMGFGLIVLAIGSVRIVGEELKFLDITGILLMIPAIAFIGFSNMEINLDTQNFIDPNLIFRIFLFTAISCILAAFCYFLYIKRFYPGISLAFYSGFMFVLSNFWISLFVGVILDFFKGASNPIEILLFIISMAIMSFANVTGITSIQKAFRVGQASNLIPLQQVPVQIAPVFYFISVYLVQIPSQLSICFLIIGIGLVIVSSFLLGKRQAQLERLEL